MEHVIPMEQSLSAKVECTEASETCRGHDQTVGHTDATETQSIDIVYEIFVEVDGSQERNEHTADLVSNISNIPMEVKTILDDEGYLKIKEKSPEVTCPMVLPMLRKKERSKDYFYPKFVSYGPYHHGNPDFQEAETLKTDVMLEFIKDSGKSFAEFYSKVREMNSNTRSCYLKGSTDGYDNNKFALMMLRDGCFILHVMDIIVHKRFDKLEEIFVHRDGFLGHRNLTSDMILLENQIPFAVLELLMSLRYGDKKVGLRLIKPFIYFVLWGTFPGAVTGDKEEETEEEETQVCHLLHRIQKEFSKVGKEIKKRHFCFKFCKTRPKEETAPSLTNYFPSFRSVRELKAKGIHFRHLDSISRLAKYGKSISLRDVEFIPGFFYGVLKLPPLILDSTTILYYYNLIAFELCLPRDKDFVVTSYISFLNTLIANFDDVKELRSKRILLNAAGSDDEVFKIFKEISSGLVQNLSLYEDVRESIENHYNSKMRTWVAEIIYKYFSNPWSALGLFVAIAVTVLSFVQAYYAIYPVTK